MFKCVFERSDGLKFVFGKDNNIVFDINTGDGVPVKISTSQGFSQIGESVESIGVQGRTLTVNGCIYGNSIFLKKKAMRNALLPLSHGKLIIGDQYYCDVYVKNSPSFSVEKNNGKFSLQFFSPTPYFYLLQGKSETIGSIKKMFSFPVNYATTHQFGTREVEKYKNFLNDGDVSVPFSITATSFGTVGNILVQNIENTKFLEIQNPEGSTMLPGEEINVYRDDGGMLRAEKVVDGESSDILSWIDPYSNLFELSVGDNLISYEDGSSSVPEFFLSLSYNPAIWSVFE